MRAPLLSLLITACIEVPQTAPQSAPQPRTVRLERHADCAGAESRACYHGPSATAGVGRCRAGVETCDALRGWTGDCKGEVLPRGETCSTSEDDDCDGSFQCPGALLWARGIVGGGVEVGEVYGPELTGFAVDAQGRMWLAGGFSGELDLGGLVLRASAAKDDVEPYVARLDRDGASPWGRTIGKTAGASDEHTIDALAVGPDGDLAVLARSRGRLDLGGVTAGRSGGALILARLRPDGAPRWARALELSKDDVGQGLAFGADDALILVALADVHSSVLGDSSSGETFVLALDGAKGTPRWRRPLVATGELSAAALAVAPGGDILVGGGFTGELAVDDASARCGGRSSGCAFVIRLDAAGDPRWLKGYGAAGKNAIAALAVDARGVALAGDAGEIDLGGGPRGGKDPRSLFIARLDPDGAHLWSTTARGVGGTWLTAKQVALAADGAVWLGGEYSDGLEVGDFVLGAPRPVNSSPTSDAFVARFDPGGVVDRAEAIVGPSFQELGGLAVRADDGALIVAGTSHGETTVGATTVKGRVFIAAFAP